MNQTNRNYITDMILFVLLMAVIGIGILMKFILITSDWDDCAGGVVSP